MHAKNRDAERDKAKQRKLNKEDNLDEEEDNYHLEIDNYVDREEITDALLEEGIDYATKASKSPTKKNNLKGKMSFDEDEENGVKGKKKKKEKKKEEKKEKFNPFDFVRGKMKKKLEEDIENEERALRGGDSEEDDSSDDDINSKFSSSDVESDEESAYMIYSGDIKLPEVNICLKSRTQDSITLNWDVDGPAMEALNEIQETHGYHFRPRYEISYQLHGQQLSESLDESASSSPMIPWIIASDTTRSHGGRIKALSPHTAYVFRAKRIGWDKDYGTSVVIRSGPGPPRPPGDVKIKEVTSNSILITWAYPEKDNGLPVIEYIVSMKAWGKEFEIAYKGENKLYLATDLSPNTIYVFEVKAKNKAGDSMDASKRVSVRTLPFGAPSMTPWIEFIDERTGKICYSHPSTGAVAWEMPKGGFIDENESFRFKRMWLSRQVYFKSVSALGTLGKDSHVNPLNIHRAKMLEQSLQRIYGRINIVINMDLIFSGAGCSINAFTVLLPAKCGNRRNFNHNYKLCYIS